MRLKEVVVTESELVTESDLTPLEFKVLQNIADGKYNPVEDYEKLRPMTKQAIDVLSDQMLVDEYGEVTQDGQRVLSGGTDEFRKKAKRIDNARAQVDDESEIVDRAVNGY